MCLDKAVSWPRILLLGLTVVEQISLPSSCGLAPWLDRDGGWQVEASEGPGGRGEETAALLLGGSRDTTTSPQRTSERATPPRAPRGLLPSPSRLLLLEPRSWGLILFHSRYEVKDITKHPFGLPNVFPFSSCLSETDLSSQLQSHVGKEADKKLHSEVRTTDSLTFMRHPPSLLFLLSLCAKQIVS